MKKISASFVAFVLLGSFGVTLAGEEKTHDALSAPTKEVYDHYIAIQEQLAKDSTKGVSDHATAIATAAKNGQVKGLPADVEKHAEAIAKAKDIKTARQAFKPLSADLIKYRADSNAGKGVYHEAYCPMARASWLQTGKEVRNPYYGKSMLDCGELKN